MVKFSFTAHSVQNNLSDSGPSFNFGVVYFFGSLFQSKGIIEDQN